MNKAFTAKILLFALLFMLLPPILSPGISAVTTYELDDDNSDPQNLFYTLDADTLTAEVYIPTTSKSAFPLTSIIIPNSVKKGENFYTVSRIGNKAFSELKNVKTIVVPPSVTYIGKNAFDGCEHLESITLPDGLTEIGKNAFAYCWSLKTISIPNSVETIGEGAFWFCSGLTGFAVGEENASYSSENGVLFNKDKTVLIQYPTAKADASYSVPEGVKNISQNAFKDCANLAGITIPASVTSIGRYAFDNTAWLNNKPDGVVYIGNAVYTYKGAMTADLNLVLPDNITCIAEYAFYKCKKLLTISIPQGVSNIGYGAFLYCDKLTAINVSVSNSNYTSQDGILFDKNKTTLIQYPVGRTAAAYAVPAGVQSINGKAFYYCSALTKISFPDTLTTIGVNAFEGCTGLTEIVIPESTTTIESYAFYYCTGLKAVTIPKSVAKIGDEVFNKCDNVTLNIYKNSTAYTYAVTNNLKYRLLVDYSITFESGYALGLIEKQTAGILQKKLDSADIIKDKTGKAVGADTVVGTGFIIHHNGIDFYVVLKGDISGDGDIDAQDCLMLKRIILGNLVVSKVQMKAACISDNPKPSSLDAFKLKKHILKNYNIFTNQ